MEDLQGSVGAAVVDEDQLVGVLGREGGEGGFGASVEFGEDLLFTIDGDDDGDHAAAVVLAGDWETVTIGVGHEDHFSRFLMNRHIGKRCQTLVGEGQ